MLSIMEKNKEMWDEEKKYGSSDVTYSGKARLNEKSNLNKYLK